MKSPTAGIVRVGLLAEVTYQIIGSHEADAKNGSLSITSPLAKALIGKTQGDSVEVMTPKGAKSYEIIDVTFK